MLLRQFVLCIIEWPFYTGFTVCEYYSISVCSQIALETVAIFGPENRDLAAFTDSVCSTVRIPHIEYRLDSNSYPQAGYSVNIHPDAELLAKAYLDVIHYFGWTEVLILYSNQEGTLLYHPYQL